MWTPPPGSPAHGVVRRRQSSQPSRHSHPSSSWEPTPAQRATSLGRVTIPPSASTAAPSRTRPPPPATQQDRARWQEEGQGGTSPARTPRGSVADPSPDRPRARTAPRRWVFRYLGPGEHGHGDHRKDQHQQESRCGRWLVANLDGRDPWARWLGRGVHRHGRGQVGRR